MFFFSKSVFWKIPTLSASQRYEQYHYPYQLAIRILSFTTACCWGLMTTAMGWLTTKSSLGAKICPRELASMCVPKIYIWRNIHVRVYIDIYVHTFLRVCVCVCVCMLKTYTGILDSQIIYVYINIYTYIAAVNNIYLHILQMLICIRNRVWCSMHIYIYIHIFIIFILTAI